jgi:hypothetical protein
VKIVEEKKKNIMMGNGKLLKVDSRIEDIRKEIISLPHLGEYVIKATKNLPKDVIFVEVNHKNNQK